MYYCQITGRLSKEGDPLHKVVIAVREKVYTHWLRNEETNKFEEVFLARGTEIVKELNCSSEGEALWNSWTPEARSQFLDTHYPHLLKEMARAAETAARIERETKKEVKPS